MEKGTIFWTDMMNNQEREHMKSTVNLNRNTPVIMLTANATRGAREEYMKVGVRYSDRT